eukprot:1724146-Rhodomonas_salina.3
MELASFGIQVKNAAQLHHSECFVGNSPCITEHPLHEVIEWKLLEQAINPFKTSAPNSLWTKLQAVIQKDFFLVIHSINLHMQEISVLCTQSIIIAEETEHNAARSLDCKTTPMLIGKLQMAEGNETLAEVGVAQGLLHFELEPVDEYHHSAKHQCLNPALPPAVAFSAEDVNNFVSHLYAAGTQVTCNTNPNIVCWNCNCIGHPKAICPYLPTFNTNCNTDSAFGRGFRGVRRVGGVRGVG